MQTLDTANGFLDKAAVCADADDEGRLVEDPVLEFLGLEEFSVENVDCVTRGETVSGPQLSVNSKGTDNVRHVSGEHLVRNGFSAVSGVQVRNDDLSLKRAFLALADVGKSDLLGRTRRIGSVKSKHVAGFQFESGNTAANIGFLQLIVNQSDFTENLAGTAPVCARSIRLVSIRLRLSEP